MIKFKRTADLYYDEKGNLVACVSRRMSPIANDPAQDDELDWGAQFIPNGTGIQELLNEIVPGIRIEYDSKPN